ncbi:Na+/H+ antiporter subunit A [Okibacterium endophyticum]
MALLLLTFLLLSLGAPALTAWLSTRVFYALALLPAFAFGYTLTQGASVMAAEAVTESVPWVPQLGIALSFRVDALSWVLALVVTGIGALVLVYCARYFSADEPSLGRFAGLMLAFAGTMYGLVTADNIYVLFVFWEITSVLSYLLIGHYTGRKESRGAALQALLVTTFGGLAMLVGIVVISGLTESTSIHDIVEASADGPLATLAIVLILVGALSKSAIVPFHFWLPAAMAAPTPVSAYLHAAAMVKAGVYLVARLAPGYAETPGWMPLVVGLGVLAMLVGGWRAMRQYDLKLLLAYGTVSQLGFLMVVVGFGTPDAALAGVALLIAHALYKATLFLVVGIIDHRAGTRDWRQLSGVGRRAPGLATLAIIAAASMAGLPPLLGFSSKESVFTALIDAAVAGSGWGWLAIIGAAIGSAMTVAYSARFIWGAFATRRDAEPTPLRSEGTGILVAPAALTLGTVVFGIAIAWLDPLIAPYAESLPGELTAHLALWHGFEPALAVSAAVVTVGLLLFWRRLWVARVQDAVPPLIESSHGYWAIMRFTDGLAARVTIFAQRGGLPKYLATILVVFVLTLGMAAAVNRTWPDSIRLWDYPSQVFIAAVMAVAAVAAASAGQRMTAVLLVGVTGFGLVTLFALHGAPDLAITQALVELATIVAFVLVLRRLPNKIAQHNKPVKPVGRALVGIAVGAVMATIAVIALGARQHESISSELPRLATEAHGANIVNVMLVDIRAWDTMGEISVLVVMATGIASLIFVTGRVASVDRLKGARRKRRRRQRGHVFSDAVISDAHSSSSRQSWLIAGETISPHHRSVILEVVVRLIFHPAIVVSVFLLFVGHNAPGGGFAGGLVAGLALVFRYLAGGRHELVEAVPIDPGKVLGSGLILSVGMAIVSLFFGGPALESAYVEADVPLLGHISFGTSTIFDVGVYLVVVGLTLDILRSLGAEIDRQLDEADFDQSNPESSSDTDERSGAMR